MHAVDSNSGDPLKVMVVEDETILCDILVTMLRRQNLTVFRAASGSEAFAMLKDHPVDVVISDVQMKNGGGVDLLDNLQRENPQNPAVILMTGFSDISAEKMMEKGCKAILKKPFRKEALLETLSSVVDGQIEGRHSS